MKHTLNLGAGVDLIQGIRAAWSPNCREEWPFFPAIQSPLPARDPQAPAERGEWDFQLSFHDSVEDLAAAVQPLQVRRDECAPQDSALPLGAMCVGDADRQAALAALSAWLGLSVEAGLHYVVVRLRRIDANDGYPGFEADGWISRDDAPKALDKDARKALKGLRLEGAGRASNADLYASPESLAKIWQVFETYGTHVLSHVVHGEEIIQVFSYADAPWAKIRKDYADAVVSDPYAIADFAYYTQPRSPDGVGFVQAAGVPCIRSGDPGLQAMIDEGHLSDTIFAATPNLLKLIGSRGLLARFARTTPIAFRLVPLSDLMTQAVLRLGSRPTSSLARDLFAAAIFLKYGGREQLRFKRLMNVDLAELGPSELDIRTSNIATSQLDFFQPMLKLSELCIRNPTVLERTTLFGLAVGGFDEAGRACVPGSDVALGGCYLCSDSSASAQDSLRPATIEVTDAAFEHLTGVFAYVDGAVALENASRTRRKVLLRRGSLSRSALTEPVTEHSRYGVVLEPGRIDELSSAAFARFKNGLDLSTLTAESLLRQPRACEQQTLSRTHINWLVGACYPLDEARSFANHLAYLSTTVLARPDGVMVPPFAHAAYRDQIKDIQQYAAALLSHLESLQQRYQQTLDEARYTSIEAALQAQLEGFGKFVENTAKYHEDAAQALDAIISRDRQALDEQLQSVALLTERFEQQRLDANTAINELVLALLDEVQTKMIGAVFDGIVAAVYIGKAVATEGAGAGEAVTKVFTFLKSAYSTVAFGHQIYEVAEKFASDPSLKLGDDFLTSTATNEPRGQAPNAVDWENFVLDIRQAMNDNLPADSDKEKAGKERIIIAFTQLANLGRARLEAQLKAAEIARDLFANLLRRDVEARQAERLANAAKLDPNQLYNPAQISVDLVGLSGSLQARISEAVSMLARALEKQDQALTYEFLEPPAPLTGFGLDALNRAVWERSARLTPDKPPLPGERLDPIEIVIEDVPLAALAQGVTYTISASDEHFSGLARVRVYDYDIRIDGLDTKAEHYNVGVAFGGQPFFDHGAKGERLTFFTPSRTRHIQVNATTHHNSKPDYLAPGYQGPQPIQVTPFSSWTVQLLDPVDTTTDRRVTLRLQFDLYARIKPRPQARTLLKATGGVADYSLTTFLANLRRKELSALGGWDVVFSLSEGKVNQLLEQQWKARHANANLPPLTATIIWIDSFGDENKVAISELVLGMPLIRFSDQQSSSAVVNMDIGSGKYEISRGQQSKAGKIEKGSLSGQVALTKVLGQASAGPRMTVQIDLAERAFEVVELGLQLDATGTDALRRELQAQLTVYFKTHAFVYSLGAVDLSKQENQIEALRPDDFLIRTVIRDTGHAWLQLFINTNANGPAGEAPILRGERDNPNLVDVDVPVPDGFDCCLMINSMILFRDVLGHALPAYKLTAAPVQSTTSDKSKLVWQATVGDASIKPDEFDIGNEDLRVGSHAGKARVSVSLSGATIAIPTSATATVDALHFALAKKTWDVPFEQNEPRCTGWRSVSAGGGQVVTVCNQWKDDWKQRDQISASLEVNFPITLNTAESQIKMTAGGTLNSFAITADARLPKVCPSEQDVFRQKLKDAVEASLPVALKKVIDGTSFAPVSVFALQNLVFPGENVIKLTAVYVPGDLVILGMIGSD